MNRDRSIIIVLAAIVAGLLIRGDSLEGFGLGLVLGLCLGAICGAAFVYGEEKPDAGNRP